MHGYVLCIVIHTLYFLLFRTTSAPTPTPTPTPTPQCKTVTEKKFIRVTIHDNPMDPLLSPFKSPDFPEIKLKKKIKCEWDVTGQSGNRYWVKVLKQFLTPNSSDTANCLYIKGKGSMCAGKVIPVITNGNRLFMRMTLDSGQFDAIQGGLHGYYVEKDPTALGGLPLNTQASVNSYPCGDNNKKMCYELSCNSTDPGPDLQLKNPPFGLGSTVQSPVSINITATVNSSTPTPSQSSPEKFAYLLYTDDL